MRNNHSTSDGTIHFRHFLSAPVENPDQHFADTEPHSQEDKDTADVSNPDLQAEQRWPRYLTRLADNAWGGHIAVQGLANYAPY